MLFLFLLSFLLSDIYYPLFIVGYVIGKPITHFLILYASHNNYWLNSPYLSFKLYIGLIIYSFNQLSQLIFNIYVENLYPINLLINYIIYIENNISSSILEFIMNKIGLNKEVMFNMIKDNPVILQTIMQNMAPKQNLNQNLNKHKVTNLEIIQIIIKILSVIEQESKDIKTEDLTNINIFVKETENMVKLVMKATADNVKIINNIQLFNEFLKNLEKSNINFIKIDSYKKEIEQKIKLII